MRKQFSLCPSFFIIVLLVAGCGSKRDLSNAETAVGLFHAQLNSGNFDQIYADSDTLLKNASPQEKFTNLLSAVHRKLGDAKSANRQGFFLNYGTNGEMIRLNYTTQFDNDEASEEFVFHLAGNDMRLAGYHINSNALVTQ